MMVYTGGTLFEAFIIRNQFDDFCKLMDQLDLEMVEVSDGSIELDHVKKCEYITDLSKEFLDCQKKNIKEVFREGSLAFP